MEKLFRFRIDIDIETIFRSVESGYTAIKLGNCDVVVAGGQESMSQAPHLAYLRNGLKMGDGKLVDSLLGDGLNDAFEDIHMGVTGAIKYFECRHFQHFNNNFCFRTNILHVFQFKKTFISYLQNPKENVNFLSKITLRIIKISKFYHSQLKI